MRRAVIALLLAAVATEAGYAVCSTTAVNVNTGCAGDRFGAVYDRQGGPGGGATDAVSADSLYWKDYHSTTYLKSSAKDQDPSPAERTAMAFQSNQTVVCMDPTGDYVYEVSDTAMRRFSTSDGSYTSYTLAFAGTGACGTDGEYIFVPRSGAPTNIDKYSLDGTYVNTTTVNYSVTKYGFAVANDTVWLTPTFTGTPIYYGYACSEFTGGSITNADSWPMPSVGGSTPMNIAWDGQYYYVGSGGYTANPYFRFYPDRTLYSSGTVSTDCRGVMCMRVPGEDVACVKILAPEDTVDSGAAVTPRAVVRNVGMVEETFAVRFAIGAAYADTVALTLAAGAAETLDFTGWGANELGTFSVACSTMLAGDANPANDAIHDSVAVVPFTGVIADPGRSLLSLDQALPNPTTGPAILRYDLSEPASVVLSIYSPGGSQVRTLRRGRAAAGHYRASWDGLDQQGRPVGAGVYLVRMKAGGCAATRKLVVRRR